MQAPPDVFNQDEHCNSLHAAVNTSKHSSADWIATADGALLSSLALTNHVSYSWSQTGNIYIGSGPVLLTSFAVHGWLRRTTNIACALPGVKLEPVFDTEQD